MKFPALAAFLIATVLAAPPLAAQTRQPTRPTPGRPPAHYPIPVRGPRPGPHICPRGQTWQFGCLAYAPAPPGKLFGACLRQGYGCMRAPEPIQ